MKDWTVEIDQDGNISVDLNGFVGSSCEEVEREFNRYAGAATTSVKKPEYYQTVRPQGTVRS